MKLLGWMHRKFRENSTDVFKDFSGGGAGCTCLAGRPSMDEPPSQLHEFDAFLGLSAATFPTPPNNSVDVSYVTPELFPSSALLSIGTLGFFPQHSLEEEELRDAVIVGDETDAPTLEPIDVLLPEAEEESYTVEEKMDTEDETVAAAMVEAIAEKAAEATTEGDLMAVTVELEKALAAVAAAEEKDGSSKRVSSARPSSGISACPLQGFLFGSPMVEFAAREDEGGAKEKRASLGELFMRSRMAELAEETGEEPDGGSEKEEEKWTAKMGFRKMIKLRDGSRNAGTAAETNNKLQKILQIFHRKVYPENATTQKNKGSTTARTKKRDASKDHVQCIPKKKSEEMKPCIANGNIPRDTTRISCKPSFNCCSARSFARLEDHRGSTDSSVNREHWIKTDADYLVLEL